MGVELHISEVNINLRLVVVLVCRHAQQQAILMI